MPVPASVRIAGRSYVPGADRGVAVLLTAASWVVQRLPGQVLEEQRAELVKTLAEAKDLVLEIHTRPSIILVRDGERPLVRLSATGAR